MNNIDHILLLSANYSDSCVNSLIKIAKIKQLSNGKYQVVSKKDKNLGIYDSKSEALKRLKQVEYFKNVDSSNADDNQIIDLTGADDFSYSAIMRELRQKTSKENVMDFLKFYKLQFDKAVKNKLQKPEKVALQNSLIKFNKLHKIKVKKKLVKSAAVSELGDPVLVGRYLADIVRFTLNRIDPEKRQRAIESLRNKFYSFNADEISQKDLPPTSAIGQSITFIKHILFNHSSDYIRKVLNNLASNL